MRRLLPQPADDVSVADAYSAPLGSDPDRPWVGLCMVSSIDGSTVVDGASAGLSGDTDRDVMLQLRSIADVVLVGSSTASGEGYGPPGKEGLRIGVVTGSGDVDTDTELFRSGAGFVVTTEDATIVGDVDVVRAGTDGRVDLTSAVRQLPLLHPGTTFVQVEGGPTINGVVATADLFDELNLTTSPAIVGGDGPRLVSQASELSQRFTVEQVCLDDESFVFTRWRRNR